MICPPFLKSGDTVRIISTARKIERDVVEASARIISTWGFQVEFGKHLFESSNQYAGTDEMRLSDLQDALDDQSIRAVFCARGGYGTLRIIDEISFEGFMKSPKWILGYSDITVLHCHLQQVIGYQSLHASMPVNFPSNTPGALDSIRDTLSGKTITYELPPNNFNKLGDVDGILVGGNLSILYSLNGSESFPDMKNKILFIEDLDEYLYHIDRIMMNLKRSGVFDSIAGLIVGGMTDMNDNEIPFGKTAHEIIRDAVSGCAFPVCYEFPAGHLSDNRCLKFGANVRLSVSSERVELTFN